MVTEGENSSTKPNNFAYNLESALLCIVTNFNLVSFSLSTTSCTISEFAKGKFTLPAGHPSNLHTPSSNLNCSLQPTGI